MEKLESAHPTGYGANNRKGHGDAFGFINPFVLLGIIAVLIAVLCFIG